MDKIPATGAIDGMGYVKVFWVHIYHPNLIFYRTATMEHSRIKISFFFGFQIYQI